MGGAIQGRSKAGQDERYARAAVTFGPALERLSRAYEADPDQRQELIRQRDALRSVGLWYLAPFIPGMALVMMGRWFQSHAAHRALAFDHLLILLTSGLAVLVFLAIWLLNLYGAKRLQQRIDAL